MAAAAAGKEGSTSLSLFLEVFRLEVAQTWAEGVRVGNWCTEQKEAWLKQIFEVQTCRQVGGLAGAVMCETRDLGIKWPLWDKSSFEGQVAVDMRHVCPKDVTTMLLKQARSTY